MKSLSVLFFAIALCLPAFAFAECGGKQGCGADKCSCAADCGGCKDGTCTCEDCGCDSCKDK